MIKNNVYLKITIFITLLVLFFSLGFISHRNRTFPYMLISKIYHFFQPSIPILDKGEPFWKGSDLKKQELQQIEAYFKVQEFIDYQKLYATEIYDYIKKNPVSFRKEILKKAILPKEIVTIKTVRLNDNHEFQKLIPKNTFKSLDNKFLINAQYYGIKHFGILEKENNKKLFIFNGGHSWSKNPLEYKKFLKLRKKLKNNGFDILSLSMSGYGLNVLQDKKMNFPINPNSHIYSKHLHKSFDYQPIGKTRFSHYIYQHFFDENYADKYPISLMLSGNYYIIKEIESSYDEIIMVGLSGGGWQTTMTSSLLPKIKRSYSFAGSLPIAYHLFVMIGPGPHPVESDTSKLLQEYDFWHFYFLSLFDEKGFQTREHNLIYGDEDGVVFYNPFAESFSQLVKNLSIAGLQAFVLHTKKHDIDVEFLKEKIIN